MDEYQPWAKYDIAETCAASISIQGLLDLSENKTESTARLDQSSLKLNYGKLRGSDALRGNLASLYSARGAGLTVDLVLYTLVQPGDHVICHYPTYEQLYRVPESLGAEVSLWKTDPSKKWQLDIEELKEFLRPETRLIVLNNPQNPTGAIITRPKLEEIIEIAKERQILVLVDEVYRPLFHSISPGSDDFPPSAINMGYDNVIVTGSMSKAYSLAGIRTGWVACRNKEIVERLASVRHYNTISVSRLDEAVAAEALSDRCVHALLRRNIALAKTNLEILENFIEEHRWACSWVKPIAGTTAMVRFHKMGKPVDDAEFCDQLQRQAGVLFCPGSRCFGQGQDFEGCVRIGYVCETEVLKDGLQALTKFMEEHFGDVPIVTR